MNIKRQILITKFPEYPNKVFTALLEDGETVELQCCEAGGEKVQLGNVYIGRVKHIVHNIEAAFIEVMPGVECYYSLVHNTTPIFTNKIGKKPLCQGEELLVQISREAAKSKVPSVSSRITLTGKYVVLTGGDSHIGASVKLEKELRNELQDLVKPYQSKEYGIIVRTNARDVPFPTILSELQNLIAEYCHLLKIAENRVCFSCLKEAEKPYIQNLRNVYKEGLTEIIVEGTELCEEVHSYLSIHEPETLPIMKQYQDVQLPLSKLYSLETSLEMALKEKVWMKSGAYLVIQPTEALTVIDVNSGKNVQKKKENTKYLNINLEAAKEAAKQIRLRNLSGIIIIDFINMEEEYLVEELLNRFREYLKQDQTHTTLIGMTKLQLVEVTRKKIRKTLRESLSS